MQLEEIYRPPQADLETHAPAAVQGKPLPPFFQTSPQKIAVLSVATFGFYQLYWFHKHWTRRKTYGEDVIPILRTIFAVWFAHSLFQSVNREVERTAGPGVSFGGLAAEPLSAGALALGFFVLNLLWRLPGVISMAGLVSFVPLVIAQRRINRLHAERGYDPAEGASYTLGTIAALVVGGLLWALLAVGIFMPEV